MLRRPHLHLDQSGDNAVTHNEIGDQTILELPVGQWVHFVVAADLGAGNSGLWTLVVTLPDQAPKTFTKLKNENATFEQLTWLGFVSNATTKTTFYLDNLQIDNEP